MIRYAIQTQLGVLNLRKIIVKLEGLLESRSMTQRNLVELTGLRAATVSELVNNQRSTINKEHLIRICDVLDIDDISKLIEIVKYPQT